jgi:hypothetical protein
MPAPVRNRGHRLAAYAPCWADETEWLMAEEGGGAGTLKGQAMQAYNRLLARIGKASSAEEVRAFLGEPESVLRRSEVPGPSETFAAFGLHFDVGDSVAEEVWVYRDPHRPRRLDCFAFQAGKVRSAWRTVQSTESS